MALPRLSDDECGTMLGFSRTSSNRAWSSRQQCPACFWMSSSETHANHVHAMWRVSTQSRRQTHSSLEQRHLEHRTGVRIDLHRSARWERNCCKSQDWTRRRLLSLTQYSTKAPLAPVLASSRQAHGARHPCAHLPPRTTHVQMLAQGSEGFEGSKPQPWSGASSGTRRSVALRESFALFAVGGGQASGIAAWGWNGQAVRTGFWGLRGGAGDVESVSFKNHLASNNCSIGNVDLVGVLTISFSARSAAPRTGDGRNDIWRNSDRIYTGW